MALGAWPKDITVAVEIRNKDWLSEAFAACLRRHDAVWVLTDQAWMLPPLKVAESIDVVTGPFAYIRLLGDREVVDSRTKTLDRIVTSWWVGGSMDVAFSSLT